MKFRNLVKGFSMGKQYWGVGNQENTSVVLEDAEEDKPPAFVLTEHHVYEQIINLKAPRMVRAGFYMGMLAGVPKEAYQVLKEGIFFPKI
ncbi:MAG: hypothetical protein AABW48_05480 [Nanoarchaeota archaeon]